MPFDKRPHRFGVAASLICTCTMIAFGVACSSMSDPASETGTIETTAGAMSSCPISEVSITHTDAGLSPMQFHFLDASARGYQNAICNDGSPAVYALRPGSGAATKRWVIDLQGGGSCYQQKGTQGGCENRPQHFTSSVPYLTTDAGALPDGGQDLSDSVDGVLSADAGVNPDFYDANVVEIMYCSSDSWSGANHSDAGPFDSSAAHLNTWSFEGRSIITGVIADLKAHHGLGDATEILFIGNSAGAAGVYVNVNDLLTMVQGNVRFLASGDAAFNINVGSFDLNAGPPDYDNPDASRSTTMLPTAIAVWGGRGDAVCNAIALDAGTPIENCYSPPYLLAADGGTIDIPMYVGQTQQDVEQLNNNGLMDDAGNPDTAVVGYTNYFAGQMRDNFARTKPAVSIFSPNNRVHEQASAADHFDAIYPFDAGNESDQKAIGAWYKNPCTPRQWIQ